MTERIICAAIFYDDGIERGNMPVNAKTGVVACGLRHANCFAILHTIYPERDYINNSTQGFLTSLNRFVDRVKAGEIALKSGQIEQLSYFNGRELDSSDLY